MSDDGDDEFGIIPLDLSQIDFSCYDRPATQSARTSVPPPQPLRRLQPAYNDASIASSTSSPAARVSPYLQTNFATSTELNRTLNHTNPVHSQRVKIEPSTRGRIGPHFGSRPNPRPPSIIDAPQVDDAQYWAEDGVQVSDTGDYFVPPRLAPHAVKQEPARRASINTNSEMNVDEPPRDQEHSRSASRGSSIPRQQQTRGLSDGGQIGQRQQQMTNAAEQELKELKRRNDALARELKDQKEAALMAKGESSMLRRSIAEEKEKAAQALQRINSQHAAELEKRRKRDEERRLEDESKRVKNTLDNHNAATYSARRPQFVPSSTHRPSNRTQQNSQYHGATQSQYSQFQQTPGPLGRKSSRLGDNMTGGSQAGMTRKGKESEMDRVLKPPVPKFSAFQNSFAPSQSHPSQARDTSRAISTRPSQQPAYNENYDAQQFEDYPFDHASVHVSAPLQPQTSLPPPMVPSHKAPARQGTFSRSISAQNAPFARSTSAQNVFARTTSGNTLLSPGRRSMIRSPMKQQQQPVRSASITPGRRGEKRRRVDLDVDGIGARDISPVREEGGASYPEREEEFESSMDDGEDDGQEEEEDVWPIDEKEVLLSIVFSHHFYTTASPSPVSVQVGAEASADSLDESQDQGSQKKNSSIVPSTPSIQVVLAPLPSTASTRNRSDHMRGCSQILAGLGGDTASVTGAQGEEANGQDPLSEVVTGLIGVARVFSKTGMRSPLTQALKLLHSLSLHLPRISLVMLHSPGCIPLLTSIKNTDLPIPSPPDHKGKGREREKLVDPSVATAIFGGSGMNEISEQERERREKQDVLKSLLDVLEVCAWEAEEGDVDVLSAIVLLPKLLSVALSQAQHSLAVLQVVRIINLLALHDSLFTPLLSFPDLESSTIPGDPTRIPLLEQLCRYLRDPHPLASPEQTLILSLDIITFFRSLCDIHQAEAIIVLGQSRSVIPTLIICLERLSAIIWGVQPTVELVSRSITLLSPILSLLSLLTSPLSLSDRPDGANETLLDRPASQLHPQPLVDLAEVLRRASASKTEFALAFEHFMVAFGRICYADVPDLDSLFAGEDGIDLIALSSGGDVELGKRSGETEGEYWEGELERAGEIARDIFDQVIEGPEGDLVYAVFAADDDMVIEIAAPSLGVVVVERPRKEQSNPMEGTVQAGEQSDGDDDAVGSLTQALESVGRLGEEAELRRRAERKVLRGKIGRIEEEAEEVAGGHIEDGANMDVDREQLQVRLPEEEKSWKDGGDARGKGSSRKAEKSKVLMDVVEIPSSDEEG